MSAFMSHLVAHCVSMSVASPLTNTSLDQVNALCSSFDDGLHAIVWKIVKTKASRFKVQGWDLISSFLAAV